MWRMFLYPLMMRALEGTPIGYIIQAIGAVAIVALIVGIVYELVRQALKKPRFSLAALLERVRLPEERRRLLMKWVAVCGLLILLTIGLYSSVRYLTDSTLRQGRYLHNFPAWQLVALTSAKQPDIMNLYSKWDAFVGRTVAASVAVASITGIMVLALWLWPRSTSTPNPPPRKKPARRQPPAPSP